MKQISIEPKTILISRTDSIGDVVLTLPLCFALKERFPNTRILFLASAYTLPVVKCCSAIDEIIDYTALNTLTNSEQIEFIQAKNIDTCIHVFPRKNIARLIKKAGIPHRIGTSHRLYHLFTCNHRVDFTRKNSPLHEAQLNFELLKPFNAFQTPDFDELNNWMKGFTPSSKTIRRYDVKKGSTKQIILHPKSQGSAIEWPIEKYVSLAHKLVEAGYHVFVTGTEKEGQMFHTAFAWSQNLINTSGSLTLDELILFIAEVGALVACSTGPLHIAGALNVHAIGLFTPRTPIHPGRWKPLGEHSVILSKKQCTCASKENCNCLQEISVNEVFEAIKQTNG